MKKLFISCPMKGRKKVDVKKSMEKMHKIAEIVFDQELEVIPSYIEQEPPETVNKRIWCLGQAIQKMADADYYIGVEQSEFFAGCDVENKVAIQYGLERTFVSIDELMPDAAELVRRRYGRDVYPVQRTALL